MRNDIDIMSLNFIRIQTPTTNDWQASWLLQIIEIELRNLDLISRTSIRFFFDLNKNTHNLLEVYFAFDLMFNWKAKAESLLNHIFFHRPPDTFPLQLKSLSCTQHRWANGWRPVLTAVAIDILKFNLTFLPTHFSNSMTKLWHMKINCAKGIRNNMHSSIILGVLEYLGTR